MDRLVQIIRRRDDGEQVVAATVASIEQAEHFANKWTVETGRLHTTRTITTAPTAATTRSTDV